MRIFGIPEICFEEISAYITRPTKMLENFLRRFLTEIFVGVLDEFSGEMRD